MADFAAELDQWSGAFDVPAFPPVESAEPTYDEIVELKEELRREPGLLGQLAATISVNNLSDIEDALIEESETPLENKFRFAYESGVIAVQCAEVFLKAIELPGAEWPENARVSAKVALDVLDFMDEDPEEDEA